MAKKPETLFKERIYRDLDVVTGVTYYKIQQATRIGDPDMFVFKYGFSFALELKASEKEKPEPMQLYNQRKLIKNGTLSYIVTPNNWREVLSIIKGIKNYFDYKLEVANIKIKNPHLIDY